MAIKKQTVASALARQADSKGMSIAMMCKKLGLDRAHFSRWCDGTLPPPDPRKHAYASFYLKAAEFLEVPFDELLDEILFEGKPPARIKPYVGLVPALEMVPGRIQEIINKAIQKKEFEDKLCLIGMNALDRQEAFEIAIGAMRTYIEKIKKEKWKDA